jgi:hypothetical protein
MSWIIENDFLRHTNDFKLAQNDSTYLFQNRSQNVLIFLFRGMEWDRVHSVRQTLIGLMGVEKTMG